MRSTWSLSYSIFAIDFFFKWDHLEAFRTLYLPLCALSLSQYYRVWQLSTGIASRKEVWISERINKQVYMPLWGILFYGCTLVEFIPCLLILPMCSGPHSVSYCEVHYALCSWHVVETCLVVSIPEWKQVYCSLCRQKKKKKKKSPSFDLLFSVPVYVKFGKVCDHIKHSLYRTPAVAVSVVMPVTTSNACVPGPQL